ncbi:MAG: pseudouridine synthase [Erysipelotrichaceae bacterium]
MERLQKVLAASGVASRRKSEQLIIEKRVSVNGVIVDALGSKVKKTDKIAVDGKLISKEELVYYVMNKPKKTICSAHDEHKRLTIVDLIATENRIFPVGRLDYDTTGVIILTNDGELTNLLTHPRYHLSKTYLVTIKGVLSTEAIKKLNKGVKLDDGYQTQPAKAVILNKNIKEEWTNIELTINEGHNHQVKKMIEAVGHKVTRLHRKSIGGILSADKLDFGQYRLLKPFELKKLKHLALNGEVK